MSLIHQPISPLLGGLLGGIHPGAFTPSPFGGLPFHPGGELPQPPQPAVAPPGFAQALHALGADPQAANLWESRHPGAIGSGNVPDWVLQAQGQAVGGPAGPQHGVIPNLPEHASDRAHAEGVITHLMSALRGARDPELKTSLSVALAALQKHVAGIHKEHQDMLAGKVSPRLMHEAYSNGNAHGGGSLSGGSVL